MGVRLTVVHIYILAYIRINNYLKVGILFQMIFYHSARIIKLHFSICGAAFIDFVYPQNKICVHLFLCKPLCRMYKCRYLSI